MKETNKFMLDKALRHLYYAVGYWRCRIVAIEFEHRGKTFRADTPKEAAELQALLEQQDAERGRQRIRAWEPDVTLEFVNSLGPMQKALLVALQDSGSVPSDTVRKALGLESELALAGVLSGLSKQAKKLKINPHDLYVVEVEWNGKEKERSFRMLNDFQLALTELGFPNSLG